jgi:hypothetical protein
VAVCRILPLFPSQSRWKSIRTSGWRMASRPLHHHSAIQGFEHQSLIRHVARIPIENIRCIHFHSGISPTSPIASSSLSSRRDPQSICQKTSIEQRSSKAPSKSSKCIQTFSHHRNPNPSMLSVPLANCDYRESHTISVPAMSLLQHCTSMTRVRRS